MEIKGATALVSGGANGLGLAIANFLQESGAKVVVVDKDTNALESLPKTIHGYYLDVTNPSEVRNTFKDITEQHGCVDILVNNAGVIHSEPFVNIMDISNIMHNYDRFRNSLLVNLDSVFIMTSVVVESLIMQRKKGAIVNISSISAYGNEGQTAYSAAKAGVNAMTVVWSKELGKFGIRCNAVAPGFIETDSMRRALNEVIVKRIQDNTPLRRLGSMQEIAQAVGTTITNDFMNGVILDVNGGLTI